MNAMRFAPAKRRVISVPKQALPCRAARRVRSCPCAIGAKDTPIPRRLLPYKPSPRGEGGPLAVDEVGCCTPLRAYDDFVHKLVKRLFQMRQHMKWVFHQ